MKEKKKNWNELELQKYNLIQTLYSGHTFAWSYDDSQNIFVGTTNSRLIKIKLQTSLADSVQILWQTYPVLDDYEFIKQYFAIDIDYENILDEIILDQHVKAAYENLGSLRLLKQDLEEIIFTFILSQNRNIKVIKHTINLLRYNYGKKITTNSNEDYYLFPTLSELSKLTLNDLQNLKQGYRSKYFLDAIQKLTMDNIVDRVYKAKTVTEKKEILMEINGVGQKVADCICVFGIGEYSITPMDLWAKRALVQYYNLDPSTKYSELSEWFTNKFGNNSALAGQFLFEYIRKKDSL